MYKVRFYQDRGGKNPIQDFIDSVDKPLRIKIERQMAYLQRFGISSENPSLKKLTGTPLWEARILGKDSTRIICVAIIKSEVFVLHIFRKKSNKIPLKDINLALKRYRES